MNFMAFKDRIKERARQFVEAENLGREGGPDLADRILSDDFTGIMRAGSKPGIDQEQDREALLATIGAVERDKPKRKLDFPDMWSDAWPVGPACWIVKGVVSTPDGRFRNTYVFKPSKEDAREAEDWRLFALQVTKLLD